MAYLIPCQVSITPTPVNGSVKCFIFLSIRIFSESSSEPEFTTNKFLVYLVLLNSSINLGSLFPRCKQDK